MADLNKIRFINDGFCNQWLTPGKPNVSAIVAAETTEGPEDLVKTPLNSYEPKRDFNREIIGSAS